MKSKDQQLLEEAYDDLKVIQNYIKNGSIGTLDLNGSRITSLPSNLQRVGGNLDLYDCNKIEFLPDKLTVGGDLDLRYCWNLKALPDNLVVGGHLFLDECKNLHTLPKNLRVGKCISLQDTNIQLKDIKYPITVKGYVYSGNFSIEEFQKHNNDLLKHEEMRKELPELEGIF